MSGNTWRFTDEQGVERNVTTPELRSALVAGAVQPSTLVWREGMKEWVPAFTLPELATAAISAARREGAHTPTLRPDTAGIGPPPARGSGGGPRHRPPAHTLVGIESPDHPPIGGPPAMSNPLKPPPRPPGGATLKGPGFAQEIAAAKAALEDTESLPEGIPPAPRMPSAVDAAPPHAPGTMTPTAPVRASVAVSAAAASLGASSTRAKSMPPPLPPRGSRPAPAGPPSSTAGGPKRTLIGLHADALRPKPPAPPKRSTAPPPMPPRTPSTPPPAAADTPQPHRPLSAPPPPLKRRSTTPSTPAPAAVAPTPAAAPAPAPAAAPTPAPAAAAAPAPAPAPALGEKTDELPVQAAAAKGVDALNEDWTEESTAQFERGQGQPAPRKPTPDAAPTLKATPKPADVAPAQTAPATSGTNGTAAKSNVAALSSAAPAEGEAAPVPRHRTLEMSAVDHQDAAATSTRAVLPPGTEPSLPVSKPPATSEPMPFMAAVSAPPMAASPSRAPMPSSAPHGMPDRSSRHSLSGELEEELRRHDAVEVPRRSIVGASLLWMIGLMTFFFVGRCAGKKASQLAPMRDGAVRFGLAWPSPESNTPQPKNGNNAGEPKPCWVSRQPTRWAPKASKSVPIDMEPTDASMSLGYAADDHEGIGILIDPKTGKFEEKFREKVDAKDKDIAWVSPVAGSPNGFVMGEKGDKQVVAVAGKTPFYVILDKDNVGFSDAPDHEPKTIFRLQGEGDIASEQVVDTPPTGYFLSFRRGNSVYGGFFGADKTAVGDLGVIPPSGADAKVGKPKSGFNGLETAVVFADLPSGKGDEWQVRLAHAKVGRVPDASDVLTLPEGGPGGRKIAPDIVGLADGRWLVMWTEGPAGGSAIRALTLTKDFVPIGDPIALSPPAGNFGQAVLGSVGDYTTVVFLQAGDEAFELWGAVLRCG